MSTRTDKVNLIISINGDKAREQLNELRKKSALLSTELKGMTANTQEYVTKSLELKKVNSEMDELKEKIGITSLSLKELGRERRKLTAILNSKQPGDAGIASLQTQLQAVIARQKEVKNGMFGLTKVAGDLGYSFKNLGVIAASYLGFQALISGIKNVISASAKFSDQIADIQRVAGLTAEEAVNLNNQLKSIDTRSSVANLLDIAIVAGKLGVAKDDIYSFTKAVDQLVVALGDELGNADQITTQLGKILNVFEGKITGDNIAKLGNAIVDLANKGVATGAFVVDFTQRLSGLAKTAGLSLASILGLGAGLEENGARVESAATAIQKLIVTIGTDVPKAAQIAGMNVKDFTDLFAKKPQEALLAYAAGLQKNKASFAEIAASFKDAGEEGARVVSTLTILGQKTDFFKQKIADTGVALQRTSSITGAFAIKNQTLGAELEKIGKIFTNIISSKVVTFFTVTLAQGFTKLLSVFKQTSSALDDFKEKSKTFDELQNSMGPLIDRVEELATTSNLSKEGQIELASAIKTIGKTIPIAITEFDKYGKAVGISTDKAKEFIALQRAILQEKNRSAINEETGKLDDLQKELDLQQQVLQMTRKRADLQLSVIQKVKKLGLEPSKNAIELADLFNKNLGTTVNKVNELQTRIKGVKGIISELNGTALADSINGLKKPDETVDVASVAAKRTALEAQIKALKVDYEKLNATDTAGQESNIALRKKYQAELDALDHKAAAAAKKSGNNAEYARLKKEAANFQKELLKMQKEMEISGVAADQAEVKRVEEKYKELLQRAVAYHQKHLTSDKDFAAQQKLLSDLQTNEVTGIVAEADYKKSLDASDKHFDNERKLAAKNYGDGLTDEKGYRAALEQIEKDSDANKIIIHQEYAGYAKSADANLIAAKKQGYEKDLANFVKTEEQKAKEDREAAERAAALSDAEKMAGAQLDISNSRPGSNNELDAKKRLLQIETDMKAEQLKQQYGLSEESWKAGNVLYDKLMKEREAAENQLDTDHFQAKVERVKEYVSMAADAFNSLNQIISNRENKELARDRKLNEDKKKNLKKQLDGKALSQAQYQKKIDALEAAQAEKEKVIRKKQAEREKALAIFQALISTASAVVAALGAKPWTPANFVFAGIVAALGALQIAAIASTPLPEAAKGEWFREGAKHSDPEGGIPVMIERDEAVIKADAMTDKNTYTVTGTPSQITSKLNSLHGGVNWSTGATITTPKFRERPAQLNPNLPRIMAEGGIAVQSRIENFGHKDLFKKMLQELAQNNALTESSIDEIRNSKDRLHAIVSFNEYRDMERQYDKARKASGLGR